MVTKDGNYLELSLDTSETGRKRVEIDCIKTEDVNQGEIKAQSSTIVPQ